MLQQRRRTAPALPVVTHVDGRAGTRTELSAVSLENAAAKIANALRDEFELESGAVLGLRLPVHWQRAAWCAGAWTAGCAIDVQSDDVDLVVTTPQGAAALGGTTRAPIVVVSLHPFGLPVDAALPPGVADVTLAVRQQPDAYLFDPPTGATPAWRESGATASQQEVLIRARELAGAWGLGTTGTLLADERLAEADGWLAALAVPLATGASVVLASNVADLESVVAQERVTARAVSAARP
jgi:uncharacterized protein (TIGR03089 family)